MPYVAKQPLDQARKARACLREDEIILAAETCFQTDGFHGAAMSQIAKTAGISVGQIYRHFPSKDDLIAKIVERDLERTLALVEAAFATGDDKIDTLVAQVGPAIVRAADLARGRMMLEIVAEASRNPSVSAALQAVDLAGRQRFRIMLAAVNGPGCDANEIEARVEVLALLIEGLPWRLVRNPHLNLETFTAHLRQVVRGLLVVGHAATPPRG
ncbi:TetR/AcrR family transcriptional regulator [soil metagenome]